MKWLRSLIVLLAMATPGFGATAERQQCLDLRAPDAKITLSGKLTSRVFAGPPNYEDIDKGDARETAFILRLPSPVCADDGEFIDGSATFDRVHVSSHAPAMLAAMRAAVGRQVTVDGGAFGAFNAHHRAPLVLFADEVTVR